MPDSARRITLWGIEVFLATAEEGSVSAAARRLGASASAVSQQLTGLELAIGTPLMDRTQRPVVLTPAGQTFRRRAQRILSEATQARLELSAGNLEHLTQLRLGMIEDFDADVTPRLLTAMAQDLRHCQFLLETGASHRLIEQLEDSVLDVIAAADMGAPAPWMEVHPLLREPFVAAVPRGRVRSADGLLTQLGDLPLIQYTGRHAMGRQIADHLAREGLRLPHRFEMDSYHAIMALVAEGAGWTILTPLGLSRAHRFRDQADVFPLPTEPLSRTICLYARKGVLQDMPAQIAERLRDLLQLLILRPAEARHPWLKGQMQILR